MKPKLLISTDCFLPRWDGIARFLAEIIKPLSKTFEIRVIAPDFPGEKLKLPAEINYFPLGSMRFGDYTPARTDKKKIEELVSWADVIFNQSIGPIGYETCREAKRKEKPIAYYVHSIEWELISKSIKFGKWIVRIISKIITKQIYNGCNLLILPYQKLTTTLKEAGIKTDIKVVPLGVNASSFKPGKEGREILELTKDNFVIGYMGRLGREKDLSTLYKAFCKAKETIKDCKLLIVGEGVHEPKEMFQDHDVIHTGSVNNVKQYLNAMDLYVLPSLTETTSLTTLEAMSCGLPVIVTPVGAIPSYITNGENGFTFNTKNDEQLVTLILKLYKNEELREKIGRAARKTIVTHWTWQHTVDKLTKELLRLSNLRPLKSRAHP